MVFNPYAVSGGPEEPSAFAYGGVYLMLTSDIIANVGNPDMIVYVSANGQSWSILERILPLGTSGAWDDAFMGSCGQWVETGSNSITIGYDACSVASAQKRRLGLASAPAFNFGGPVSVADVPAERAANVNSLQFTAASSQFVQISGKPFETTGSYTIACSAKRTDSLHYNPMFSKWNAAASDTTKIEKLFSWIPSNEGGGHDNAIRLDARIGGTWVTANSTSAHAQVGSWHRLLVRVNVAGGNTTVGLCFDGIADGNPTFAGVPTVVPGTELRVGVDDILAAPPNFANGEFSDLKFWNSYLSDADVAADAANTAVSVNPAGWWKFNEGSGVVTWDSVLS